MPGPTGQCPIHALADPAAQQDFAKQDEQRHRDEDEIVLRAPCQVAKVEDGACAKRKGAGDQGNAKHDNGNVDTRRAGQQKHGKKSQGEDLRINHDWLPSATSATNTRFFAASIS